MFHPPEVKLLRRVRLFAALWTVAYQAPLSMGFSRQEYWSGLLFPSPEDLPDPGIEPRSPALQADALPSIPLASCMYLVGAFNPLTFKVVINMCDPISVFLIVLGLFFVGVFLLLCFLPKEVP